MIDVKDDTMATQAGSSRRWPEDMSADTVALLHMEALQRQSLTALSWSTGVSKKMICPAICGIASPILTIVMIESYDMHLRGALALTPWLWVTSILSLHHTCSMRRHMQDCKDQHRSDMHAAYYSIYGAVEQNFHEHGGRASLQYEASELSCIVQDVVVTLSAVEDKIELVPAAAIFPQYVTPRVVHTNGSHPDLSFSFEALHRPDIMDVAMELGLVRFCAFMMTGFLQSVACTSIILKGGSTCNTN